MYRLVLMLAKSLHHASTANLLVCLPELEHHAEWLPCETRNGYLPGA